MLFEFWGNIMKKFKIVNFMTNIKGCDSLQIFDD